MIANAIGFDLLPAGRLVTEVFGTVRGMSTTT